jgi:spore germination protein
MIIHVVKEGDTLESIAGQYGVPPERITIENELPNPEKLVIGQSIGVRVPDTVHTVAEGDTLSSVAKQYGVQPNQILQRNPQAAVKDTLTPGTVLVITYANETKIDTIITNGYVYPFVDRTILSKTLPLCHICLYLLMALPQQGS